MGQDLLIAPTVKQHLVMQVVEGWGEIQQFHLQLLQLRPTAFVVKETQGLVLDLDLEIHVLPITGYVFV